jgi:hypothetical protein
MLFPGFAEHEMFKKAFLKKAFKKDIEEHANGKAHNDRPDLRLIFLFAIVVIVLVFHPASIIQRNEGPAVLLHAFVQFSISLGTCESELVAVFKDQRSILSASSDKLMGLS